MDNSRENAVQDIHGHDVIDLIRSSPAGFTQSELTAAVVNRFGKGATFHTCSAQGMSLEQLLQFLFVREKIVVRDGRLKIVEANVCNHG